MKIKSTTQKIFTINSTLKDLNFDKKLIVKNIGLSKFFIGKFDTESDDLIDEIILIYKPATISKLKYLYHVKKVGANLSFYHFCYSKLNLYQHLFLSLKLRFIPWILKMKNLFKIIMIMIALTNIYFVYNQLKNQNNIQKVEIVNKK